MRRDHGWLRARQLRRRLLGEDCPGAAYTPWEDCPAARADCLSLLVHLRGRMAAPGEGPQVGDRRCRSRTGGGG
eukprot:5806131-Prorocentrum_lima.AAC.1